MSEYTDAVKTVKSAGRFGDTEIMHVSPLEVAWMHENSPTGLTINPETGQPEAFLPLLGAFLGSTFAAELGLTALMGGSVIGGSMLGAGLGSFGGSLAQGDPWQQALAGGALAAGTTGLFQGILGAGEGAIGEEAISAATPGTTPLQNYATAQQAALPGSGNLDFMGGLSSSGTFGPGSGLSNTIPSGELAGLFKTPFIAGTGPGQAFSPASYAMSNPGAAARAASSAVKDAGMWGAFKEGLGAFDFASPEGLSAIGLTGAGLLGDGLSAVTGTPYADIPDFTKDRNRANIPEQFPVLRDVRFPGPGDPSAGQREFGYFRNPVTGEFDARRPSRLGARGGLVKKYQAGGRINPRRLQFNTGMGGALNASDQMALDNADGFNRLGPSQDMANQLALGGAMGPSVMGTGVSAGPGAFGGPAPLPPILSQERPMRRGYADGGQVKKYQAGGIIPPLRTVATPPPGFRHGFQPEFDYFGGTQNQTLVPNVPIPTIPGHMPIVAPSSPKLLPPVSDGDGGDIGEIGGRSDVGLDEARSASAFINSPLGLGLGLAVPGGGIALGLGNLAANATAANALGVDVANNLFGPSAAINAVNATGLTTADFATPSGLNVPSIQGINLRADDRFGSPRNEAGTVGIDASFSTMAAAEAQEADEWSGYDSGGDGGGGGGPSAGDTEGSSFAQGGGPLQAQPQQNPVVMGAIAAIMGNHPEPQRAIQNFVQVYGQQAFTALRQQVIAQASVDQRGGAGIASLIQGEGDGLSDDVPANIEGQEPVALSDGEVVVPADVVSGLGNGSSEAGAREIEKMNQDVRQVRTGTRNQPEAINTETMLPGLR